MLSKKKKMMIGGMILLFMMSTSLIVTQPAKALGYVPSSSLTFDEWNKTVDVSPGANGTAIFTGTLHVECESDTTTKFNVTKSCGMENWTIVISPLTVNFPGGVNETNVTVIVSVPTGAKTNESGSITVYGETRAATPLSYYCHFSTQMLIVVNPYHSLSISCSNPYQETTAEGNLTFEIQINNNGNTNEFVSWGVKNENELNSSGIKTIFCSSYFSIEGNDFKNNPLIVYTYKWAKAGTYEIKINVSSLDTSVTMDLIVVVKKAEVESEKPTLIPNIGAAGIITVLSGCAVFIGRKKICIIRRRNVR